MLQYLAIDIGGSKSKFVVFDKQRFEIDCVEIPGVGLACDSDEDIPLFRKTILGITEKHSVSSVAVNLGGKNKGQIYRIIKECIPNIPISVYRESEGNAALAFGKLYDAEVVLLAGTGTIAIASSPTGERIVSGGWGMNISDAGSGYYIGMEAIRRSLLALDKRGSLSEMEKEITGCTTPILPNDNVDSVCLLRDKVRSHLSPFDRKHIASYAKLVVKHGENGEPDALLLLKDAGIHMGLLVVDCANKLLPYEIKKVAVSGGLVNCCQFWREEFEKTVRTESTVHEFVYVNDGILLGTKELAVQQYK